MNQDLALSQLIPAEHRIQDLQGLSPDRIVEELLEVIAATEGFDKGAIDSMKRAILNREREATTGIGNRVALPHLKGCSEVNKIYGAVGRSAQGVEWAASDGAPVHLFFLVLAPTGFESEHIRVMRKMVMIGRDRKTVDYLIDSPTFDNIEAIFSEVDSQGND